MPFGSALSILPLCGTAVVSFTLIFDRMAVLISFRGR